MEKKILFSSHKNFISNLSNKEIDIENSKIKNNNKFTDYLDNKNHSINSFEYSNINSESKNEKNLDLIYDNESTLNEQKNNFIKPLKKIIFNKDIDISDNYSSTLGKKKSNSRDINVNKISAEKINFIERKNINSVKLADNKNNKINFFKNSLDLKNEINFFDEKNNFKEYPAKIISIPPNLNIIELSSKINYFNFKQDKIINDINNAFFSTKAENNSNYFNENHEFKKNENNSILDRKYNPSISKHEKTQKNSILQKETKPNLSVYFYDENNLKPKLIEEKKLKENFVFTENKIFKNSTHKNKKKIFTPNKLSVLTSNNLTEMSKKNIYKNNPIKTNTYPKKKEIKKFYISSTLNTKNNYEKNENSNQIDIFQLHPQKPKWIIEQTSTVSDKNNMSSFIEHEILNDEKNKSFEKYNFQNFLQISNKKKTENLETEKVYNKIFDKNYRKIFDRKFKDTKEYQEQILKILKIKGKPDFVDDKIMEAKKKIYFMKGIFDYICPKILGHKLKVQKKAYDKVFANHKTQQFNKIGGVKYNSQNKEILKNSEFYTTKEIKNKISTNIFLGRINSGVNTDIKIQTRSTFRNIITPFNVNNRPNTELGINLERFYSNRKKNNCNKIDFISKNLLKNS